MVFPILTLHIKPLLRFLLIPPSLETFKIIREYGCQLDAAKVPS